MKKSIKRFCIFVELTIRTLQDAKITYSMLKEDGKAKLFWKYKKDFLREMFYNELYRQIIPEVMTPSDKFAAILHRNNLDEVLFNMGLECA